MGKASIGYCAREDNEIKSLGSLIIEKEHSTIEDNRRRRRAYRTLKSHKAREKWFYNLWKENKLNPLENTDEKFKKEFSKKGDSTIYNSTILRIALIQGKKLEEWQIYKAIHNAIQRRGYDSNVAWANSIDDKENKKAIEEYSYYKDTKTEMIKSEEFKYPCFYDALLLGLWNEETPYEYKNTMHLNPTKIRVSTRVAPRNLVIKELSKLWEEAKKQLPQLEKISVEEFLYGDYREAYGSYVNPEWIQYRGTNTDWQGVLGQKIPRFDNRIISKCRLLPKRNVCSSDTIENISLVLLLQLKNLRFIDNYTYEERRLAPFEINQIYKNKLPEWCEKLTQYRKKDIKNPSFTISKTDIENVIGKKTIKEKFDSLKANISGRSSFCRRACQIMIEIIISGINPLEINIEKYVDKQASPNPITKEEIKEMLIKIGKDWNSLTVNDNRYEINKLSQNNNTESDILIGNITNPVVRNRLQIFKNLLNDLISINGKPDEVIFEFIRDGEDNSLYGSIKAKATSNYMKEQEKENKLIKKELNDISAYSETNFLKHKLAKAQNFMCIYSGRKIGINDYSNCQIDHICPRSIYENDAFYNKILCYSNENQEKGARTPYEWLNNDKQKWAEYTTRVLGLKSTLGKKKTSLLIFPPEKCKKLLDNYNGLAETAQIAKIASLITHFICGWGVQVEGQSRHVFIETGSTTSQIRKTYKLNAILGNDKEKNRNNPKHHALDAICISYAKEYKFDKVKHEHYIKDFNRAYIEQKIFDLMPYPYTHKKILKSNILPNETIYGKRIIDNNAYITSRVDITTIKKDKKYIENIIDNVIKLDLSLKLEENFSDEDWKNLLKNYIHPKKKTKVKKVLTIISKGELEIDSNGRERIGEYADFGTKGTKGQYKHSKQHKGQILYYNEKGTIKVMPIFSNKSIKSIKEKLQEMNYKLYNGGEIYNSGCLIEIPLDFKNATITYSKGIYKLKTMKSKGDVELENNTGDKISTSAKNLVLAKFKRYKK